jgi:hypothetical protein
MNSSTNERTVYIIFDTLYERVICIHGSPGMTCEDCCNVMKDYNDTYGESLFYTIKELQYKVHENEPG